MSKEYTLVNTIIKVVAIKSREVGKMIDKDTLAVLTKLVVT
jgi:hypothetical protein